MRSPIADLQRQLYPPALHPLGALANLGQCLQQSRVLPRASRTFRGFGDLTTSGALTGAKTGATAASLSTSIGTSIGTFAGIGTSFAPVIGTAIGVIIGLIASGVFNHRVDPEVGNFNNAVALYNSQGANAIFNIADKYLVLAGLFDLEPGQIKGNIPMVKKYGRMGEQAFTQDFANLIYNAAQAGKITANDTPQSVFNNVVQPWLNSFGYGQMQDANGDMLNAILLGMVAEYVTGLWKTRWFARSGDMPNWHIPVFALPSAQVTYSPGPSGTPTPATQQPTSVVTVPTNLPPAGPQQLVLVGYSNNSAAVYNSQQTGLYYTYSVGSYPLFSGVVTSLDGRTQTTVVNGQPTTQQSVTAAASPVANLPATMPPSMGQSSAVAIPSGFTLGGNANGLGAYVGPDGLYYSWNGTSMTLLTGTLTGLSGAVLPIANGVVAAPPSATGVVNLQPAPPAYSPPVVYAPAPAMPPAPLPATRSLTVAGVSLPSWALPAALGVIALMFATARPVQSIRYVRKK